MISAKTDEGFESFGKFYIGCNADIAKQVFNKLKGDPEVKEDYMLLLELMETRNGLPVNLKVIGCTLTELADNCKTITAEIFKAATLHKAAD